jgi:hypothetical protein
VTSIPDVAHTKSISNAPNNQAVSLTIGSKPNANSNEGCFGRRRRARKGIRDIVRIVAQPHGLSTASGKEWREVINEPISVRE